MTDAPRSEDAPGSVPAVRERDVPRDPVSAAALERYTRAQRRPRMIYAAVVAAVVVVLGLVFVVAWTRGETNNATLRTVATPPADLALATPGANPAAAWRDDARAAIGDQQWRGTVVTFDRHTVGGVDARTGDRTWSYDRSDRTVCTAAQLGGVTIAVYRLRGNCDEVTAVDSQTGERRWTRTLDMDGMPVNGTPRFVTSEQGGFGTLLVQTDAVIYAIDPATGYNRWTYTRYGCTITGLAAGSTGALIAQTCSSKVQCASQDYCKPGRQLLLRSPYDPRDDKSEKNPDKITWNLVGTTARPLSADTLVSAIASGAVLQLDNRTGRTITRTPLRGSVDANTPVAAADVSGTEIVSVGATTYALRSGTATPVWTRTGTGPTTVRSATATSSPTAGTARITLPITTGVETLDVLTGRATTTSTLAGAPTGRPVFPLGAGFLVAGGAVTAAYR